MPSGCCRWRWDGHVGETRFIRGAQKTFLELRTRVFLSRIDGGDPGVCSHDFRIVLRCLKHGCVFREEFRNEARHGESDSEQAAIKRRSKSQDHAGAECFGEHVNSSASNAEVIYQLAPRFVLLSLGRIACQKNAIPASVITIPASRTS